MTSLKTSIKTITYLSDIGCLEIQGASLESLPVSAAMKTFPQVFYLCNIATQSEYSLIFLFMSGPHNLSDHPG